MAEIFILVNLYGRNPYIDKLLVVEILILINVYARNPYTGNLLG